MTSLKRQLEKQYGHRPHIRNRVALDASLCRAIERIVDNDPGNGDIRTLLCFV